jgi:hypothetical protein
VLAWSLVVHAAGHEDSALLDVLPRHTPEEVFASRLDATGAVTSELHATLRAAAAPRFASSSAVPASVPSSSSSSAIWLSVTTSSRLEEEEEDEEEPGDLAGVSCLAGRSDRRLARTVVISVSPRFVVHNALPHPLTLLFSAPCRASDAAATAAALVGGAALPLVAVARADREAAGDRGAVATTSPASATSSSSCSA